MYRKVFFLVFLRLEHLSIKEKLIWQDLWLYLQIGIFNFNNKKFYTSDLCEFIINMKIYLTNNVWVY